MAEKNDNLDKAVDLLEAELKKIDDEIAKLSEPFQPQRKAIKEQIALLKSIKNGTFTGPGQPVKRTRQKRS